MLVNCYGQESSKIDANGDTNDIEVVEKDDGKEWKKAGNIFIFSSFYTGTE